MKTRKWVLVVAAVLSIVLFGWYGAWRTMKANEKIRFIILDRMKPFLSPSSHIGQLEVGLRSVQLRDVLLVPRDSAYTLEVKDMRIGYNLIKLIAYRFAPSKIANELVMEHPVFTIIEKSGRPKEVINENSKIPHSTNKWVNELETIKRIAITDAKIIIENKKGQKFVAGHSMEGFVRTERADSARIRLTGGIFSKNKNNLHIDGVIDLVNAIPLNFHVKIDRITPKSDLNVILPPYLSINKGYIEGELFFGKNVKARGFVNVEKAEVVFKGINLIYKGVDLNGDFFGDSLLIKGGVNSFNGSKLRIEGKVKNVFSPDWDLNFLCPVFKIPEFFHTIVPGSKYAVNGRASYYLNLKGTLSNPTIKGYLKSSDFTLYGIILKNYSMAIGLEDSILTLEGSGSRGDELSLGLSGNIDFSNDDYASLLSVALKGSLLPLLNPILRRRLKVCGGAIDAQFNGKLQDINGKLSGKITTLSNEGDTLLIFPALTYFHDSLNVKIKSNKTFGINGYVYRPFRDETDWALSSQDVNDLIYPMVPAAFKRIINPLHIGLRFEGLGDKWNIHADAKSLARPHHRTFFTLNVTPLQWKDKKRCRINSEIFNMSGNLMPANIQLSFINNQLLIDKMSIGRNFSGKGVFPFKTGDFISAQFKLKKMDMGKLKDYFLNPPALSGFVSTNFDMSGTANKPTINFSMDFEKGYINKVGPLDGKISANWDSGRFMRIDAKLNRKQKRIVFGSIFRIPTDSLNGSFKTDTLYIKEISKALFKRDDFDGLALVDIRVSGKSALPVVSGNIEVTHGRVGFLSFNKFKTNFRDSLYTFDKLDRGNLVITDGIIKRNDDCNIRFFGNLPHSYSGDLDFTVDASGNVLGMLKEISPLVKKSYGKGNIFLRFAGKSGNWVLGSAKVNVTDGNLELSSLFKSLKDVQISAEMKPGDRFLSIDKFKGTVHRVPVVIKNIKANNKLPNLRINKLGIDIGNIIIETEKPVRMNLPGIMEKGSEGKILFSGQSNDNFSIGGPSSNPKVKGTLELFDFRLTYPFIKVDDKSSDGLDYLLSKLNWDLHIVPKKDVHYTRDIKTAMGNVFADLKLRDNVGSMNLKGTIEKGNFEVWGNLTSTEGSLEVLEHFFRPEQITFDLPRKAREPILSGRAFTTITDSLGMPATVWLSVAVKGSETGIEKSGVVWENIRFKFSTDNPNLGRNEADLMAALGYSTDNMKARAYDALGTQVENLIFRPIFRPIERGIRRHLGLDVVRFSSMFSRNLFQMRTMNVPEFNAKFLLRSTRWTLGKYIGPGIFITYTGQVQNEPYYHGYMNHGIGFRHALSLEFTIKPDIFLEFEYTYDSQLLSDRREDKKVWLRHIFPF